MKEVKERIAEIIDNCVLAYAQDTTGAAIGGVDRAAGEILELVLATPASDGGEVRERVGREISEIIGEEGGAPVEWDDLDDTSREACRGYADRILALLSGPLQVEGETRDSKDAMTLRIEFRRLLRALEHAIEAREGHTSTSWSIQQAMRHETDKERVLPARGKLDEFVADLIDRALRSAPTGEGEEPEVGALAEKYISQLSWTPDATDQERTLVTGNLRGFAAWLDAAHVQFQGMRVWPCCGVPLHMDHPPSCPCRDRSAPTGEVEAQEPKPGEVWRHRDRDLEVNVAQVYGEPGQRRVAYTRPEWSAPLEMSLALWPSHYVRVDTPEARTLREIAELPVPQVGETWYHCDGEPVEVIRVTVYHHETIIDYRWRGTGRFDGRTLRSWYGYERPGVRRFSREKPDLASTIGPRTMQVCPDCGNRRCPRATDRFVVCMEPRPLPSNVKIRMLPYEEPRTVQAPIRLDVEEPMPAKPLGSYDLVAHLHRQRVFSRRTFGPGPTVARILDHARKEIAEIERDPADLEEWIDLATLAFDGAWRQGYSEAEIAAAFEAKLAKNERRTWPDWRTADPSKAIEHVREETRELIEVNGMPEAPASDPVEK